MTTAVKTKKKKHRRSGFIDQPKWFTNKTLQGWGIFLMAFLLYSNTIPHDYTQDDAIVITDNTFTQQGISGIPGILTNDTFFGFFNDPSKANLVSGGRYRPLTLVMFALEREFFGQSPVVGHLINALLYGLTGVYLFWLFLKFFPPRKRPGFGHWVALTATLLFIAHPLHTEAVANIKGRDEVATLLFSVAALYYSFVGYRKKQWFWMIISGILFLLALLSKENAITFLAIVPLSFYFFTKATPTKIIVQTLPFAIAACLFLVIRSSVLDTSLDAPVSRELMNNPFLKWNGSSYEDFNGAEKIATITYTLGKYLQLLVFPHPLTHDYYPRHVGVMSILNWRVILSLLIHLGLLVYALFRLPGRDPISFCILFYLLTLSIVSNILFPIGTNMSERFLFMPSVAFCLAIPILLYRHFEGRSMKNFAGLTPYFGLIGLVFLLFSAKTVSRNFTWKDNFKLFTTDIQTSPRSAKLRNAVGGELLTQALKVEDDVQKQAMIAEAIGHLNEAIQIHPLYKNAYLLLGNAHSYLDRHQEAIQFYTQALNIDPDYRDAVLNQAITYMNMKEPEKSLENIERLTRSYPLDRQYQDYLAMAYRDLGRKYGEQQNDLQNALVYLNKAFEINPKDYETLRLLGVAMGMQGRTSEALSYFEQALEVAPSNADALYNLGTAHYNAGNQQKGDEFRQRALQLDPEVAKKMGGQ